MQYRNVYWSKNALEQDQRTPTVLAIGDSWFWYPFPGGSLLNKIGDVIDSTGRTIIAAGNNGAEAFDFVDGKYRRTAANLFRLYGGKAEALLLSAGGNDFAGFNDLRPLLNDNCANASAAKDCFVAGDEFTKGTVNWLMYRMFEHYATLISRAAYAMPADAKFYVHNYDYAVPTGIGVAGGEGWIRPALKDAKVPDDLQQDVVDFLIEAQTGVLERLQASMPDRIVLVDGRDTLGPEHWHNELHPTPEGFDKLARERWRPHLQAAGLAH